MEQKRLVIVLADISGYTRFMLDNRSTAVHGQVCIDALIEALVAQVDIPLVLQEIEGDAVFLHAADPGHNGFADVLADVARKLDGFFAAFIDEMSLMGEATPCACAVCANLPALGLKLIVHVGEAVFHRVAGRDRVSGPDVILAHRLLKNSVPGNEYLLLTGAAHSAMKGAVRGGFESRQEYYAEFGTVELAVRDLSSEFSAARAALHDLPDPELRAAIDRFTTLAGRRNRQAALYQALRATTRFGWTSRGLMVIEALASAVLLQLARGHLQQRLRVRGRPRVA